MLGNRGFGIKPGRKRLLVGLTGNFGAGKSTVSRFFKRKGAAVFNADQLAHEVYQKGNPIYPRLKSLFPGEKNLSRQKIAQIVFKDKKKRCALEALIHPYVLKRICEKLAQTRQKIVILEVPLLFESGFDRQCDRTIVIKTKAVEIIKRLSRTHSQAEILARWQAQMPLPEKIWRADYVIDNAGCLSQTRGQVEKILKKLNEIKN